jgi:hypothetical protein
MLTGAGYSHNVEAGLYRGGSGSCSHITTLQFRFELSFTTNGNFIDVLLGVNNINTKSLRTTSRRKSHQIFKCQIQGDYETQNRRLR